jgi:hypothetical protein
MMTMSGITDNVIRMGVCHFEKIEETLSMDHGEEEGVIKFASEYFD